MNEVVEHIGTPRTKPRVLAEDPDVDRQVFIAQNKEAQIYYSNTTLKLFRSLADSTFELLNFPMELRKWDCRRGQIYCVAAVQAGTRAGS